MKHFSKFVEKKETLYHFEKKETILKSVRQRIFCILLKKI